MIIPSPTRATARAPPKFHEQLGIIGNSELQGRMGRSRVRRSEPAIHVAAVHSVRRPEPSGQVGDLPLPVLRLGRGSGCQRRAQHLGGRGHRRRSANVGRWAVRRSRTVCGSCLTRHFCISAPIACLAGPAGGCAAETLMTRSSRGIVAAFQRMGALSCARFQPSSIGTEHSVLHRSSRSAKPASPPA